MLNDHFVIDLDRSPEVLVFEAQDIMDDLEIFGLTDPMDLADFDRKIFKTEEEAEKYLEKYLGVMRSLPDLNLKSIPGMPKMLYKRRFLVQTILGEKMKTYRHYKKPWPSGTKFQLHDQTYFYTVELISIEETEDGYCYNYKNT
jgi:hypothetical protein